MKPDIDRIPAITQSVTCSLDFPYAMHLQDFLLLLDKTPGTRITAWMSTGAGGGNPVVRLVFRDHAHAMAHLRLHYPDDNETFLESLITLAH